MVIVGTDPIFAILVAVPLKFFAPSVKIVHWCFDLHPEAAISSALVTEKSIAVRFVRKFMRIAYSRCDLIVDIGSCMRELLNQYQHSAGKVEPPWALLEPSDRIEPDIQTRKKLFNDAKLSILYSGNFGEAHSFNEILALARSLRHRSDIAFCFAVRGNKVDQLNRALEKDDVNISFADFASLDELELRLGAADIHVTTLLPEWSNAIPSKFFGSLAIGRPVLFAGPSDSAIAHWIEKYKLGWVLNMSNIDHISGILQNLASSSDSVVEIQKRAHSTYLENFSRYSVTKKWNFVLLDLLQDVVS